MKPIQTILCPTDFSPASDAALAMAIDLAKALKASVRVLHVFQLPFYVGWENGPAAAAATESLLGDLRKRGRDQLELSAKRCSEAGVSVTTDHVDGVPHSRIVELSQDVSLVVMGTHGRTGLPRLMIGSVAERVVRLAHCPVLTVPAAS
jgi:nucleotide-binding universal stress UspA family protein